MAQHDECGKPALLSDHVVDNHVIFPGAGYRCMALETTYQVVRDRRTVDRVHRFTMQDVVFSKPLTIPDLPRRVEVQLTLVTRHALISNLRGWNDVLVSSLSNDGVWSEHCRE